MKPKGIKNIHQAPLHHMGSLPVHQPFPARALEQLDPFILLHHHGPHRFEANNNGLPFGPHPHRGFETITLIYSGNIQHQDSRGHKSTIETGGVQWMTAGMGIIHSENIDKEMREHGGEFEIIQLWLNLPAKLKMIQPAYQGFNKEEIPAVPAGDGRAAVHVYSGEWENNKGPVKSLTGVQIATIALQKDATVEIPVLDNKTILFYVLDGSVEVNGQTVSGTSLVEFQQGGDTITIQANESTRILLGTADALHEPMISHGPYVMNTQTEIMVAMRDYKMGKMGVLIEE